MSGQNCAVRCPAILLVGLISNPYHITFSSLACLTATEPLPVMQGQQSRQQRMVVVNRSFARFVAMLIAMRQRRVHLDECDRISVAIARAV